MSRTRPNADVPKIQPPRPELQPKDYTVERIQEGIAYVDKRLGSATRKPSPNLSRLLVTYKTACQDFLEQYENNPSTLDRSTLLTELRSYEEDMSSDAWFREIDSQESHKYKQGLLQLRLYQCYARYGDYAKMLAHDLRITACAQGTPDWELLSREFQWNDISKRIYEEHKRWEAHGLCACKEEIKTTRAVHKACLALGADFDQMLLAIHTYGNRNETLHNHVGTYADEGKYAKLAETLSKDLNDLSSIIPLELKHEETLMRAILLELRDKWFEIEVDEYIQPPPDEWFPTEALRDMHRNRKLPEVKAAAKVEHDKSVLRGAQKRLHRAGQIQELVQQLSAKPDATALPQPGPQKEKGGNKRQESNSNHLSPSKRKKVWLAISKHQVRACSAFSSSLDLQKQVNMMTASYRTSFGSSPPSSPSPSQGPSSPVLAVTPSSPQAPSFPDLALTPSSPRGPSSPDLAPTPSSPPGRPDWWVKIADFGTSKRATEGLTVLRTVAGTLAFVAPEILVIYEQNDPSNASYTNAVDIWSLGVIAFLIFTSKSLFEDSRRLVAYVQGKFEIPFDVLLTNGVSEQGRALVKGMLAVSSKDRPIVEDCLSSQWIYARDLMDTSLDP
ncbi:hypothetical protein MMC07_006436 [Pseudocyphellaria aurata]|nr:hypothetical protein [Pseudocyphellaria aurata]